MWRHDPILRTRELLTAAGLSTQQLDQLHTDATAEMNGLLEAARAAPYPEAVEAFTDVQDADHTIAGAPA